MIELSVSRLNKRFGGNHVLKDVSFDVSGAEMIGLIGPNGAGKTTLTNVLDGAVKPNSGTVYLNGTRIDQLPSFEVAKAGLGRTFQVTRSFRRMTVLENLYVPAMAQGRSHKSREVQEEALEVLDFLPIKSVDPFSGLIVTGYGTPPGGNRSYRASIFVSDPSLDARSLKLSLQTKSGPVSMSTQRAIEESILTRARQLRKQADRF